MSKTDSTAVEGKALTEEQLLNAGLTSSELPAGLTLANGGWERSITELARPTAEPACQPLVELLFTKGRLSAKVDASYQVPGMVFPGSIELASYRPSEARPFFASVKQSLHSCSSMAWTSNGTTNKATIAATTAPKIGDDSLGFSITYHPPGTDVPTIDVHEYFQVGDCILLVDQMDANTAPPQISPNIIAAQVAKLKAAQGG